MAIQQKNTEKHKARSSVVTSELFKVNLCSDGQVGHVDPPFMAN